MRALDARRWLRLDAWYCGGAAVLALAFARPLASFLRVDAPVVAAAGAVTALWTLVLGRLASRDDLRPAVRVVAAVNAGAALAVALLAAVEPSLGARLLLAAVAVEVAAFAGAQARAARGS
jgi:hypothetical protein